MGQSRSLLSARGLVLGYGATKILQVDALAIDGDRGVIVGLQGPNGAGKSTFLKASLGLHKPSAGVIKLLGAAAGGRSWRAMLATIGYVPQARPAGVLRLTVGEVVESGRYGRIGFMKRRSESDKRAIRDAMERTGVAALAHRAVQELSGGQYQRVQIARALASEPELLLLDEPASHLDAEGQEGIVDLLSSLARDRTASMIMVSHDEALLKLCDIIVAFADGQAELRYA